MDGHGYREAKAVMILATTMLCLLLCGCGEDLYFPPATRPTFTPIMVPTATPTPK
jgi:predicted small lipoprotein YifL